MIQALYSVKQQDKTKWPETDTQEVPPAYEEKLLYCKLAHMLFSSVPFTKGYSFCILQQKSNANKT